MADRLRPVRRARTEASEGRRLLANLVTVVTAADDATVRSTQPATNFGGEETLTVKFNTNGVNAGTDRTYLKFDVSQFQLPDGAYDPSQVNRATLRVLGHCCISRSLTRS